MIKKMLLAAAVAAVPVALQAQSSSYFGARLSFDVTHPAGCNDGINNGSGFTLTGIYNMRVGQHVYFEPGVGVFYNTMGIRHVEYRDQLFDGSVRNFGLRIPLNVGYRFSLFDNFDLSAFTGPWFNVNLSTKAHLQPNFESPDPVSSPSLFDYGWHRFDMQWGFGIAATYASHYYIAVTGGIGVSSMATFSDLDGKHRLRRNTVSITVGYNF